MKTLLKNCMYGIIAGALLIALVNIYCTKNFMESPDFEGGDGGTSSFNILDATGGSSSLSKQASMESYSNSEGKFEFNFGIPQIWVKTSHGRQNIKGTSYHSDVFVYSPSLNYIPRFTIIVFGFDKNYKKDKEELYSIRREDRIKKLAPDRFLGRVERGYGTISGINAPMVVYDMLDETKKITYRSKEYTLVFGGQQCTIQFTQPFSGDEKNEISTILNEIYDSFEIKAL